MTADDARKIAAAVTAVTAVDGEKVRLVLDCWHRAIRKAAESGLTSVREYEVDRPRTPIPSAARQAAFEQLRAGGFDVRTVQSGINESEVVASWGPSAARVLPRGGSGTSKPRGQR